MNTQTKQLSMFPTDDQPTAEELNYVAICRGCGAVNWIAADEPQLAKEIGRSMRDSVRRGDQVLHIATEQARHELKTRGFKCSCGRR